MNTTTPAPTGGETTTTRGTNIVQTTANTGKNEFARKFYEKLVGGRLLTDEKGEFFVVSIDGERPPMMMKKSEYDDPTAQFENLRIDGAEIYAQLCEKRESDSFRFSDGDYRRIRLREWSTGCAWKAIFYMPVGEADGLRLSLVDFFTKFELLPGVISVVFSGARFVEDERPSYGRCDIVPYDDCPF